MFAHYVTKDTHQDINVIDIDTKADIVTIQNNGNTVKMAWIDFIKYATILV